MDLEELYDRLLRYCCSRTRDRYLAEDIVQETFVRFYANHTYRETGKKLPYLYTIARNLCIDAGRRTKEFPVDDMESLGTARPAGPDNCTGGTGNAGSGAGAGGPLYCAPEDNAIVDRLLIEQALERLSEEDRDLVMLRYSQGLSAAQIGEITGQSRWAIHRRLQKCLKTMKEELEGKLYDE